MFLKKCDFLSPQITLYFHGSLSHSSILSGILTIITSIILIITYILYIKDFKDRKDEIPKLLFFTGFKEDVGLYSINSSSLFHYINIKNYKNNHIDQGIDFTNFRIIGFNTYFQYYLEDKNLTKFDHWLYGLCNNYENIEGNLINKEYFTKSACIKKYFDSKKGKYFEINSSNFIWPSLEHGTSSSKNKFYSIIIEKCEDNSLKEILGEGFECKNNIKINETFKYGGSTF